DGISVRQAWADLQPAAGAAGFNWNYLDTQLSAAAAAGKKVSVVISSGGDPNASNHSKVPQWVYHAGAKGLTSTVFADAAMTCSTIKVPVPWDATYKAKWEAMIDALATHFHAQSYYSSISHIKITGINEQTDETALPRYDVGSTGTNQCS